MKETNLFVAMLPQLKLYQIIRKANNKVSNNQSINQSINLNFQSGLSSRDYR